MVVRKTDACGGAVAGTADIRSGVTSQKHTDSTSGTGPPGDNDERGVMEKHLAGVVAALLIVAVCLAGEPQSVGNRSKAVNKAGIPSTSTSSYEKKARLRGNPATPARDAHQPVRWVNGKPLPWPWDDMPYRVTRPGDGC